MTACKHVFVLIEKYSDTGEPNAFPWCVYECKKCGEIQEEKILHVKEEEQ